MKKAKRNLLESAIVLIVLGFTMVVFPSIFETAEKYKQNSEDGLIIGSVLIVLGFLLLLLKWYISKKK